MTMTLADAQTRLALWEEADAAVSAGLSYSMGGRQLTRENANEIHWRLGYWQRQVHTLQARAAGHTNPGFRTAKFT